MYVFLENVALERLRQSSSTDVLSWEEAEVLIKTLESHIDTHQSISAPELDILVAAAIIRTPNQSINLINPIIMDQKDPIISLGEACFSFPNKSVNCIRYNYVRIENGLNGDILELAGEAAILAQHEIDHLDGIVYHDRSVKLATVNESGIIYDEDFCPCGSRKRFFICCAQK